MKKFIILLISLYTGVFLFAEPVKSSDIKIIGTGSGFSINRFGNIITNAHVVNKCKKIFVLKAKDIINKPLTYELITKHDAVIKSVDNYLDLAVIKSQIVFDESAAFVKKFDIKRSKDAYLIGFPNGEYKFKKTELISHLGPNGEEHLLQFTHSGMPGNSGGPLLDNFGDVIGVVTAKYYKKEIDETTGDLTGKLISDSAVSLKSLVSFSKKNQVFPKKSTNYSRSLKKGLSEKKIEEKALKFTVQVFCGI